jgi:hypothetical protein
MAKSDMKEDMKMDTSQDKAMIKKAFKQHDAQEHKGGKGTALKLAKGGKTNAQMKSLGRGLAKVANQKKSSFTYKKGG